MQADYINQHIPRDDLLIMAGDFNDWHGQDVSDFASVLGLRDAAIAVNGKMARTFPARIPILPLDRIYIRGLTVKNCATYYKGVWRKLSDHAALIIDSELP